MTGFSQRAQADEFAALLPDPPPASLDWPHFLETEVASRGYDLSDIRIIDSRNPPAWQLLGNAVEKWVVQYEDGWQVRDWKQDDEFAEGEWNEDLNGDV